MFLNLLNLVRDKFARNYLLSEALSAGFLRDDELTLLVSSCLTQICS